MAPRAPTVGGRLMNLPQQSQRPTLASFHKRDVGGATVSVSVSARARVLTGQYRRTRKGGLLDFCSEETEK